MTRYYLVGDAAYPEANLVAVGCGKPVAVIDPDDTEAVERLDAAYRAALDMSPGYYSLTEVMQHALREFANPKPPKPDEPTGLGAVVEDKSGRKWVRSGHSYTDPNWRVSGGDEWVRYADIDVVRKLSDGVTEGGAR